MKLFSISVPHIIMCSIRAIEIEMENVVRFASEGENIY
jgi:hypothetical protein